MEYQYRVRHFFCATHSKWNQQLKQIMMMMNFMLLNLLSTQFDHCVEDGNSCKKVQGLVLVLGEVE